MESVIRSNALTWQTQSLDMCVREKKNAQISLVNDKRNRASRCPHNSVVGVSIAASQSGAVFDQSVHSFVILTARHLAAQQPQIPFFLALLEV